MKKRLRYAMPHVPLQNHNANKCTCSAEDKQTKNYGTNVATMAKIITAGEKQKILRRNPPEISCEVDTEISGDEENERTLLLHSARH